MAVVLPTRNQYSCSSTHGSVSLHVDGSHGWCDPVVRWSLVFNHGFVFPAGLGDCERQEQCEDHWWRMDLK